MDVSEAQAVQAVLDAAYVDGTPQALAAARGAAEWLAARAAETIVGEDGSGQPARVAREQDRLSDEEGGLPVVAAAVGGLVSAADTEIPVPDGELPAWVRDLTGAWAELEARLRGGASAGGEVPLSEFWVDADQYGGLHLSAPCLKTIGCLFGRDFDGRATLGELAAAAAGHTGLAAGEMHARFAAEIGGGGEQPPNHGNPVIWTVTTGGYVCAVPVPGRQDSICGQPLADGPCPDHAPGGVEAVAVPGNSWQAPGGYAQRREAMP